MKCRLFEGLSIRLSKGLSETAANISILNHFDRDSDREYRDKHLNDRDLKKSVIRQSDRDDRDEIVEDTHIAYNEE